MSRIGSIGGVYKSKCIHVLSATSGEMGSDGRLSDLNIGSLGKNHSGKIPLMVVGGDGHKADHSLESDLSKVIQKL